MLVEEELKVDDESPPILEPILVEPTKPEAPIPPLLLEQKQRGHLRCGLIWIWEDQERIVPLKDVNIKARVDTGLTKTQVQLTYHNVLSNDEAVEVQFEYPLVEGQVVAAFSAVIGNRDVIAIIKNKE